MFTQFIYFPPQGLMEPLPPLPRTGFCDIVLLDLMDAVGRVGCGVFACDCV